MINDHLIKGASEPNFHCHFNELNKPAMIEFSVNHDWDHNLWYMYTLQKSKDSTKSTHKQADHICDIETK